MDSLNKVQNTNLLQFILKLNGILCFQFTFINQNRIENEMNKQYKTSNYLLSVIQSQLPQLTKTKMIHNIARHYTKTFNFFSQYKVKNNLATILPSLQFTSAYKFSTQSSQKSRKQQQNDAFSPIDYYRNTIRRVNIRTNGRGRFSSYNLKKIINMSSNQQHAKVMFEAYYNYMGHFTLIPNSVVDSLVIKAIQIGNQVQKVMDIFSHHNYLTYFPHFDATNRFIRSLADAKDQQNLQKILRILIRSPLIKINTKIVENLLKITKSQHCQPSTKQYVLKVLLIRKNLIQGINQEDLLSKISQTLQEVQFGPFQPKPMVQKVLTQLLASSPISTEDTVNRLILTSTFGLIDECGSIIANEQQQIGTQYDRFFDYLIQLYPRSSQQVNYGTLLKSALAEAKLSIGVSQKLEKLVNESSQ